MIYKLPSYLLAEYLAHNFKTLFTILWVAPMALAFYIKKKRSQPIHRKFQLTKTRSSTTLYPKNKTFFCTWKTRTISMSASAPFYLTGLWMFMLNSTFEMRLSIFAKSWPMAIWQRTRLREESCSWLESHRCLLQASTKRSIPLVWKNLSRSQIMLTMLKTSSAWKGKSWSSSTSTSFSPALWCIWKNIAKKYYWMIKIFI